MKYHTTGEGVREQKDEQKKREKTRGAHHHFAEQVFGRKRLKRESRRQEGTVVKCEE